MRLLLAKNRIVLVCLVLYFLSLVICKLDVDFNYNWIVFWIYIISIGIIVFWYLKKTVGFKKLINLPRKEKISFATISLVAIFISLLFIKIYPFVSVGDGVRDAGLDGLNIYIGTIKNLSGYDVHYGSQGNIIPLLASFFYPIFSSSVLTYRIPSAIIFCLDVMLLYVLLRLLTKRSAAFIGALVYILFPLHIFMARTELVLIFDSFWTSAILLSLYVWLEKRRKIDYIFLGTILGIAATFHTSARVLVVLVLIIVFLIEIKNKFNKNIFNIILLGIFCLVGFGPMLINSNSKNFFSIHRSILNNEVNIINYATPTNKLETIKNNYKKSLMVWFYEGTTSRYPEHKPILPPFLALFFVVGVGYAFFILKKPFYNILILLVFLLPLTNSAMTDWVNADHRLAPLLPIAAIFIALGFSYITKQIHNKIGKILIFGIILMYLVVQTYKFFTLLPANYDYNIKDYLSMHVVYLIKRNSDYLNSKYFCLFVSNQNKENLNLMHYMEQYEFFLPNISIETKSSDSIGNSEAYILKGSCENYENKSTLNMSKFVVDCSAKINFYCPNNYNGNIKIYYQ